MARYVELDAIIMEIEKLNPPFYPTLAEKEAYKEAVRDCCSIIFNLGVTPIENYTTYMRKDIFIEKVCRWLQKEVVNDYEGLIWENLIDDFKKYMKGE